MFVQVPVKAQGETLAVRDVAMSFLWVYKGTIFYPVSHLSHLLSCFSSRPLLLEWPEVLLESNKGLAKMGIHLVWV